MKKTTILFLAANPIGTDRLALDREAHAILGELQRSGHPDCFEFVTRWAAEPVDLLRELRKLKPTVVHFSGRGGRKGSEPSQPGTTPRMNNRDAGLAAATDLDDEPRIIDDEEDYGLFFQAPDGHAQFVSTSALRTTFGAAGSSVRLVVLNACYSVQQAEALLDHVDCVVGMRGSINHDTARSFAIGFYGALADGESIAIAYKNGQAAITLQGLPDIDRPQLRIQDALNIDRLSFGMNRKTRAADDNESSNISHLEELSRRLRTSNRSRIDEYVGDKYISELYVTRRAERDIAEFLRDREELTTIAKTELRKVLNSKRSALDPSELELISQAISSLRDVTAADVVARLTSALMPRGHARIRELFENYRLHVSKGLTSADLDDLRKFNGDICELLRDARAPETLLDKLTDIYNAITESKTEVTTPGDRQRIDIVRYIAPEAYRSETSSVYMAAMKRFDQFLKEFESWGDDRVILRSRGGDNVTASKLIQRCKSAVTAAHRRCLFIVDAAGSGKTNLFCNMALGSGWPLPTIVLFARGLGRDSPICLRALDSIASDIGYSDFSSLVKHHHQQLEDEKQHILVLIDGINEYVNDSELALDINELVAAYSGTRVRFVVTCRDIYWKYFDKSFKDSRFVTYRNHLRTYSDDELIQALAGYLEAYGLRTRVEGDALERFRSPILLRFFCEAYGVRGGDGSVKGPLRVRWINLKRLFDDYRSKKFGQSVEMSQRKRGYKRHIHQRTEMDHAVSRLGMEMHRLGTAVLSTQKARELINAGRQDSRISAFQLLLNEDVIIEEHNGMLTFVYEAFMEYILARNMLAEVTNADEVRACILRMTAEAVRFGNMRGAVLMALVMLIEERDIAMFAEVLQRGNEWRDVILSAISQLSPKHATRVIDVLISLTQTGNVNDRREALRILSTNAGAQGQRAMVKLVAAGSATLRGDALVVLKNRGDSEIIRELMLAAERGNAEKIAPLLLAMVPSRRAVDRLAVWAGSDRPQMVVLGLRVLARAPAGEYRRVIDIAKSALRHPSDEVLREARNCLARVQGRAIEGERNRRRQISRARRRAARRGRHAS